VASTEVFLKHYHAVAVKQLCVTQQMAYSYYVKNYIIILIMAAH